ncbi:MAG: DUF1206 domain-containing protein [Frankiaceae bacterium]|nr:DUF1206 domain-containing protein [Frankiaceae bacterium]
MVEVAVDGGHGGRQANAHGALAILAANPLGLAGIALAAVGFVMFGLTRMYGAWRDREAPRWRRVTTGLQGLFYVGLAWVPASFVLGHRQTGSEQQQHQETAAVFRWPLGRELVALVGVIVIVVCVWQIRTAWSQDFTDGMALRGRPSWLRRLVRLSGSVGIAARALVFVPVGGFLIWAAVQSDPRHANGLDAELAAVARHAWGGLALADVAAGLAVFAVYSGFEARYRRVARGE